MTSFIHFTQDNVFVLCMMELISAYLCIHAICVLNHMTRKTNHIERIAYVIMAVGAFWSFVAPLYHQVTYTPATSVVYVGVALYTARRTYAKWRRGELT